MDNFPAGRWKKTPLSLCDIPPKKGGRRFATKEFRYQRPPAPQASPLFRGDTAKPRGVYFYCLFGEILMMIYCYFFQLYIWIT